MSAPILSILLACPDDWPMVADQLHAEMFTDELRPIFTAYEKLAKQGKQPDVFMVADVIPDRCQDALQAVAETFASRSTLRSHVQHLRDKWQADETRKLGQRLASGMPLPEALELLTRLNANGAAEGEGGAKLRQRLIHDLNEQAKQEFIGLTTGIRDLDDRIGGLRPGNLCVMAGRPGMGKTALALNVAQAQRVPVAFFSLEMSSTELATRWVASSGVDYGRLLHPHRLQNRDWEQITAATSGIPDNLKVYDTGGQTIDQIEAASYRQSCDGLGLIVVDYLQLVNAPAESRLESVSQVSRRLKALAKNLNVPVIALSQLNRNVENRGSGKPGLSDLRESGQIEQDADQVIFIHRPEVIKLDGEDLLIVAKNRAGQVGDVKITWEGRYQRFVNYQARMGAAA